MSKLKDKKEEKQLIVQDITGIVLQLFLDSVSFIRTE